VSRGNSSKKNSRPQKSARPAARSGNPARRGAAARPAGRGAAGRPLPRGNSFFTPGASPYRQKVEQASAPLLVLFHRLPRVVFGALPLLLLVGGAFLPLPIALPLLVIALLLLAWLAFLSWPRAEGGQKVMRLIVPGLVVAILVLRLGGS
jgi:hypothetical protein